MDSDTQQPDGLTTQDVIRACAARDIAVSRPQLSRWAAAGYVAQPRRKGLGRGRGTVELWQADIVERIAVIVPLMRTGKNVSYAVAWALLRREFDIAPSLLRDILTWYVGRLETMLTLRGYPANAGDTTRRTYVKSALRRRWPAMEDAWVESIVSAFVSFNDASSDGTNSTNSLVASAIRFIGPASLKRALESVADDAVIRSTWEQSALCRALLPSNIAPMVGRALVDGLSLASVGASASTDGLTDDGLTAVRLYVTLALVALHHYGDAMATTMQRAWDNSLMGRAFDT